MSKLSDLVTRLARVSGRPEKTVREIARRLRENGHLPTGGRGPSAAEMNHQSAATLLLGTNIPEPIKEVAEQLPVYRALETETALVPRPRKDVLTDEEKELFDEVFGFLQIPVSLGDALQQLVLDAKSGKLQRLVSYWDHPEIRFNIRSPAPAAWITFKDGFEVEHGPEFWPKKVQAARRAGRKDVAESKTDHALTASFTHRSIIALGEALRT